jgi:hypothetical protein
MVSSSFSEASILATTRGVSVPCRLSETRSGDYSQHGEHGVIEAVFREIGSTSRTCVDCGAYDLRQLSNVYPLWTSGWRALLIEGDSKRYAKLRADYAAHPQHDEQRVHIANRFVSETGPDSLDRILSEYGFPTDLDLVSIDVDGLDLHIWRGLVKFGPRLVIVEYNPTIPPHIEIIGDARGNNIGSSALAVTKLGRQKGYSLVACIGWNAFFVHEEHAPLFADANDLDALFDYSYVRYAMQSYSGEVFFSAPLHLAEALFSKDSDAIEWSSVPLEKTRNNRGLLGTLGRAAMRYCLRPLKGAYRRARVVTEGLRATLYSRGSSS